MSCLRHNRVWQTSVPQTEGMQNQAMTGLPDVTSSMNPDIIRVLGTTHSSSSHSTRCIGKCVYEVQLDREAKKWSVVIYTALEHLQTGHQPKSEYSGAGDRHHEMNLGLGRPAIPTDNRSRLGKEKGVLSHSIPTGTNSDPNISAGTRISGLP